MQYVLVRVYIYTRITPFYYLCGRLLVFTVIIVVTTRITITVVVTITVIVIWTPLLTIPGLSGYTSYRC